MSIKINRSDVEAVVEYLDYDVEIRDYSGRNMFGNKCLGLITSLPGYTAFVVQVAQTQEWDHPLGDLVDRLHFVHDDGYGLSTIYYWPGVELVDE